MGMMPDPHGPGAVYDDDGRWVAGPPVPDVVADVEQKMSLGQVNAKLAELRGLVTEWNEDQQELGRYADQIGGRMAQAVIELDEAFDAWLAAERDRVTWTQDGNAIHLELAEQGRHVLVTVEAHRDATDIAVNGNVVGQVSWDG